MLPHVYLVSFSATASASALDWFELASPSSRGIVLLGLDIAQTTELGDAAEEQISWTIKRSSGAYTSGSGGSSATPRLAVSTQPAATFTAEVVNTTQITGGTTTTLVQSAFNLRQGLEKWWTPETWITLAVSEALTIGMAAAPADSVTWVGTAYVGELV